MLRTPATAAAAQELYVAPAQVEMTFETQFMAEPVVEAAPELIPVERNLQDLNADNMQSGSYMPSMDGGMATLIFLLNIIAPGVGTFFTAFLGGGGNFDMTLLVVSILQMVLAPFLIGWLWSIRDGYVVWQKNN